MRNRLNKYNPFKATNCSPDLFDFPKNTEHRNTEKMSIKIISLAIGLTATVLFLIAIVVVTKQIWQSYSAL